MVGGAAFGAEAHAAVVVAIEAVGSEIYEYTVKRRPF